MGCRDIRGGRSPRFRDDQRQDRGTPPRFDWPMIGTLCGVEDYILCVDVPGIGRLEVGRPWPNFGEVDPPYKIGEPIIVCPLDRKRRMHPALSYLPIVEFYDCSHSCRCACDPATTIPELPWGWFVNKPGIVIVADDGVTPTAPLPWGWTVNRPELLVDVPLTVELAPLPWGWAINAEGISVGTPAPGVCVGSLDDEFPEDEWTDNTPLEGTAPEPLDGNCVWGPVWSQMMDMTYGTLSETSPADLEFVYNTDTARSAIGGDPTDAVTHLYPSNVLIGQELEGFAGEFGTSYFLSVGLARSVGGPSDERGSALILYTAKDHHFSVQWDRLGHTLRLVSWDGDGNKTEHDTWTDGGANQDIMVAVWRMGGLVKVACRPVGDAHSLTFWADPVAAGGHVFDAVDIDAGHDKLAIGFFTATAPFAFPSAYVFHLCCNANQGDFPPWGA